MAYQSLYRRYRPQKFSEIRGQRHVVSALQNAVVKGEVGHAYLLHGPRGTGKTTSARVLAKALNCENLGGDGEPCGDCESCVAIEQGRSFDLHELDAASNNKVEDMRDLLGKVNLGNPGRAKVYILDEVHMLTPQAENALLKTLEEPPAHVTWVLATTEPHKVVGTIRSRCQVLELSLLGADEMADHVRWVIDDAELEVAEAAVDHVVAAGGGSVRDTLSALDRVVAAGGTVDIDTSTDTLLDAIGGRDVAAALAAVGDATGRGRDPRIIGESILAGLRDAFLTTMGAPPPRLSESQQQRAEHVAGLLSPATMTRALETLGVALVEMRQAPDPRVDLEVALVRLCRPDADRSLDALSERLDRIEQGLNEDGPGAAPVPAAAVAVTPPPAVPAPSARSETGTVAGARRALAAPRAKPAPVPAAADPAAAQPPPVPAAADSAAAQPSPVPPPVPAPSIPSPAPAVLEGPDMSVLRSLRPSSPKEIVELAGEHLGLSRAVVVSRALEMLGAPPPAGRTSADLARLWGALLDEAENASAPAPSDREDSAAVAPPPEAETIDPDDLVDAPSDNELLIERLTEIFPGAKLKNLEEPEAS